MSDLINLCKQINNNYDIYDYLYNSNNIKKKVNDINKIDEDGNLPISYYLDNTINTNLPIYYINYRTLKRIYHSSNQYLNNRIFNRLYNPDFIIQNHYKINIT